MGSSEPLPPDCVCPGRWRRDNLPPSPAQVFCPWPHSRPGRWESDAKAHGPQPAGSRCLSHSLAPAPMPSCAGQPLPGAWVLGRPPQRRGNSRGSLGLAAGRCLPSKPTSALAGCVFRRVIALSGSRCLYAEIRAGLPLPPALGCGEDDSCHSQRVVGS